MATEEKKTEGSEEGKSCCPCGKSNCCCKKAIGALALLAVGGALGFFAARHHCRGEMKACPMSSAPAAAAPAAPAPAK